MSAETFYTCLEVMGAVIGLLYLWLEYKASIYLWIVGVIMPSIYLFVYYEAALYADVALNVYYLLAAVYGWMMWKRKEADGASEEGVVGIRSVFGAPRWLQATIVVAAVLLLVLIAQVLMHFTDSEVPWFNALNASLSIVGMWMLAKKYVEQWWVWVAADIACAALYFHTGLYLTAALYALYTVIAVFGYFKWKKMMAVSVVR